MATISPAGRRVFAVAIRHGHVIRRSPHRIFDIVVWPVVDSVLYGSIARYSHQTAGTHGSGHIALLVVSGIIMWHVVYQAQIAVSTSFFEESYSRQLPSLFATPLRPAEWLLGAALHGMIKVVAGVTAVAVAVALLYGFNITDSGPGIIPVMALLLLTGWALAVLVAGLVLFLGSGSEALTWGLLFVILPLSGALFPVSALPAAVRPLSAVLPTTHTFDAARAVAAGAATPWGQLGIAAAGTGVLIAATLGFAAIALHFFWRRGFITRYL